MIILEGPDGAGKSTLGLELSKRHHMPLIHTGGPVHSPGELFDRIENLGIMHSPDKIFDRVPIISELIYAPIQNRKPFISREASIDILDGLNVTIYYCRLESIEDMFNLMVRKKPHKSVEWFEEVQANYKDVVVRYDSLMDELRSVGVRVIYHNWRDQRCVV